MRTCLQARLPASVVDRSNRTTTPPPWPIPLVFMPTATWAADLVASNGRATGFARDAKRPYLRRRTCASRAECPRMVGRFRAAQCTTPTARFAGAVAAVETTMMMTLETSAPCAARCVTVPTTAIAGGTATAVGTTTVAATTTADATTDGTGPAIITATAAAMAVTVVATAATAVVALIAGVAGAIAAAIAVTTAIMVATKGHALCSPQAWRGEARGGT
mmetsp:Transcript_42013/g.84344  ORF Transcript_42013/g.84344 Transcript_42013/m.84344 type:complete len:219 (-) Transcript_42013:531-1187(-)